MPLPQTLAALAALACLAAAQASPAGDAERFQLSGEWHRYYQSAVNAEAVGDYARAAGELRKGAHDGDALSMARLGECYLAGRGVERDMIKFVFWMQRSAGAGNVHAYFEVGEVKRGTGNPGAKRHAHWLYSKGAEAGDVDAMLRMGEDLMEGRGCKPDPARAVYWYERAASRGAVEARLALADIYAEGRGAEADPLRSLSELELAAMSGSPKALRKLARRYAAAGASGSRATLGAAMALLADELQDPEEADAGLARELMARLPRALQVAARGQVWAMRLPQGVQKAIEEL